MRHKQSQKMEAVADDADDRHADKHHRGKRKGDNDLAGDGVAVGDQPQKIRKQDEHEEGENEWKELAPALSDIGLDHVGHKLIAHLSKRLPSAGNERVLARAEHDQGGDQYHRDRHQKGGVGIGDIDAADVQRNEPVDLELMEWVEFDRQFSSPRRPTVPWARQRPHRTSDNPPDP